MTVWRITDGEDGVESGERASPATGSGIGSGPGSGDGPGGDIVELDTALLHITASPAAARLVMNGEIDVSNAGDVTRALDAARGRVPGCDVHVDLTAVDFVDVAGLRAFNLAARDLHEDGRMLVLHAVSPHIDKLFATIGWSSTPGLQIHCGPRA
ncbi:anti-sigma factor antagonist [Actinomadura sp. KC216]|uniref:STAS domain-containing protein n=1 Tax=Actinomadura sp. KC216 TaxID=2530370 RepID=UPI0010518756|nr:STAS domain-containing protein [Actinomadura sp. KC216]TDB86784.1 anti-sigma factor antagonist [Actinomadura sp. KC216]